MKNNILSKEYLKSKAMEIKEHGNMLGIRVTIPNQDMTELIINDNSSIENKLDYYCKTYDDNLIHCMNDRVKIVDIEEIKYIISKCSDEIKKQELLNRGFKETIVIGIGAALFKEYKNDYHYYGISIGLNGDVIITNYDQKASNVISFNFNKEFVKDLIFILNHLEMSND